MKRILLLSLLAVVLLSAFKFNDEPSPILGRWEFNSVYQSQPFSFLVVFTPTGIMTVSLTRKLLSAVPIT